jgi:hypothetical protein
MEETVSSFVKPGSPINAPFDPQNFKVLLEQLKKSREQLKNVPDTQSSY